VNHLDLLRVSSGKLIHHFNHHTSVSTVVIGIVNVSFFVHVSVRKLARTVPHEHVVSWTQS
jgi:hypothetical protein